MTNNFRINGYTDSHNECDRCGKNNLNGTYNIDTEDGSNFYLGSSCIKKAYQMNGKELSIKISEDKKHRIELAKKEFLNSDIGIFYKKYIGSDQHKLDIKIGKGFSIVSKKTKKANDLRNQLCEKYNIRFFQV